MAHLRIYRPLVTLLVVIFTTQIHSQKILSDRKKCGDPQCEGLMMRVSAKHDYFGPDCRFLSFKTGDEINVYYKLSGRREDLWQGSKGKAYGFFPKDTVTIEEVYLREEIEIPAQEIDFVCLDGGEYVFENEDSVLHSIDETSEELIDFAQQEGMNTGSTTGEDLHEQSSVAIIRETPEKQPWAASGIAGWFGMGESNEKRDSETESKKINLDIINENAESQKQIEEVPPEKSSWLGGGIKKFLPFGEKKDESQAKNKEDYIEKVSAPSQQADLEQKVMKKADDDSKSKWFNFGIRDVLGFGARNEKKESNMEGKDNEIIPEHLSQDEAMADQTENSGMDQVGNKIDDRLDSHNEAQDTVTNAPEKDVHAKEEFTKLKEIHLPHALTEMDNTFGDESGEHEEKPRIKEQENFPQTSESIQADKDTVHDETNGISKYPDLLSQRQKHIIDEQTNGKDHYLQEVNQPKVHNEDTLIEREKTFHDERKEDVEKPGLEEAEPSQTLGFGRIDEQPLIVNDYPDTLSQEVEDGLTNGSVIMGNHEKAKVTNYVETDQPNMYLTDKGTELTDVENVSRISMTLDGTVKENSEEHEIGTKAFIENKLTPMCSTRMDQDCISGLATTESRQDELSSLSSSNMGGMEIGRPEKESHIETSESSDITLQLKSQEDTEIMESRTDTSHSSKEKISAHCDVEGTTGTDVPCKLTKPLPQHWKQPQDNPGSNVPLQSYPEVFAIKVMLRKIFSRYSEVHSQYLAPVRLQVTSTIREVVSLLPDDLQPGTDFYGCPWDVVIFTALFGFLSVLMFTCRTLRCIKSRFYASRESKLGDQVAEALSSKREVLEKLSIIQKQYEDVEQKLQQSGHLKLLTEISEQKAVQESLQTSNKELEENISKLEQELEEEKQRGSELDYTLSELTEKIKSLEEDIKKAAAQKEETRTTQKVFEINKGRLESSIQDAAEEKSHLEESIKQLSKEAEGWEERFSELSENSRILSSSVGVMQEDLGSKQSQIKALIENLLSLKDWSSELDEVNDEDDNDILSSIKWDFENGEPLGDPQKQRIKKLIYAAMLNASLKSLESEKKNLCDNLSDEMKVKEQLAECITNLQNTSQSLFHEKSQLEEEVEKLKQKMSVMMEVYQENERKLHRKLTVQEKERMQKEAKLSKADEKMNMATSELITVKTRVSELEEEMDKTVSSYQNQVTSYEKKSHDNWLTARAAERYLSDVKKETAHFRQKLTEAEYKLELLEKDPFALDVIQAIGRENSPFGMSPINRHPESRAFLSPPTLLEGPLRLSPMLPGADRGVRPPGYYPGYPGPKERGDANSDRRADHQRTLSDAGSLSPPWDREQRNNVPPPGLPYPEPPFPYRRAERFYHYPPPSGRFSGPAELTRNQGKPFMDAPDGRSSPEYKARITTSRNGEEEVNNVSGASSQDNEVMDGPPGEFPMHPPPPMRVPLLPRDPRAPYFRRPLMPHPPMEMYGPPGYPGMPPPHIPMRNPVPPPQHHYPAYPALHGEVYFPPQPIRPPHSDSAPPPPPPTNSLPPQDKLPEPTT